MTTPGPWKVDERVGCIAVYPESETHNCLDIPKQNFVAYWHGYIGKDKSWQLYEKDQANAYLIATAPDMYQFLIELTEAINKGQERIGAGRNERLSDIIAKVRRGNETDQEASLGTGS